MRLSSVRQLLLVLVMVMQTVAGGASVARAASFMPQFKLSAPCHQLRAAGPSDPADKAGHRHDCQSCLLCAEPPPVWFSAIANHSATSFDFAPVAVDATDTPSPPARAARSHCARAPPGAGA